MAAASTLKRGSQGPEVSTLQQQLGQLGYALGADGAFGPKTHQTVEEFQAAFGYDVDGIVGAGTHGLIAKQIEYSWNVSEEGAIKRALEAQGKQTEKGSLAGADLKRTLKKGLNGGDVAYLQRRLGVLGFAASIDGDFGPGTEQAVRNLQEAFGYTTDGIVGSGTHTLVNAQIGHGYRAPGA